MSCSLTAEVFAYPILGYIVDTEIANGPCWTELTWIKKITDNMELILWKIQQRD